MIIRMYPKASEMVQAPVERVELTKCEAKVSFAVPTGEGFFAEHTDPRFFQTVHYKNNLRTKIRSFFRYVRFQTIFVRFWILPDDLKTLSLHSVKNGGSIM